MELTTEEIKEDIQYHWDLYKLEHNKFFNADYDKMNKHGLKFKELSNELERRHHGMDNNS